MNRKCIFEGVNGNHIDCSEILIVDISDTIATKIEAADSAVFYDYLYYAMGNFSFGAYIPYHRIKNDSKKLDGAILQTLDFLEKPYSLLPDIKNAIECTPLASNSVCSVVFTINGKKPIEIFRNKYIARWEDNQRPDRSKIYTKNKSGYTLKPNPPKVNNGICHICGEISDDRLNSCVYTFYTNDKEINYKVYNNDNTLSDESFMICGDCLHDILRGKRFIENHLTTYWCGGKVFIIPSMFNSDIKNILDTSINEHTLSITDIQRNENMILYELGRKQNIYYDIIFYEAQKSAFKINASIYSIRNVRFTELYNNLSKYKQYYKDGSESVLRLRQVLYYLIGKPDTYTKDKVIYANYNNVLSGSEGTGYLQQIFNSNAVNRDTFFKNIMQIYKFNYMKLGKSNTHLIIQIYNFLVDCGCMQEKWENDDMQENKKYTLEEYFDTHPKMFNTSHKKAWFTLGNTFSSIIWTTEKYHSTSESNEYSNYTNSALRNKYIGVNEKFDKGTFMEISRTCWETANRFGVAKYISSKLAKTEELYGESDSMLAGREAQFYFFHGLKQRIYGKNKDVVEGGSDEEIESPEANTDITSNDYINTEETEDNE